MNGFCYKFISDYGSAKFIKIGSDFTELFTKICCHVFMPHSVHMHLRPVINQYNLVPATGC